MLPFRDDNKSIISVLAGVHGQYIDRQQRHRHADRRRAEDIQPSSEPTVDNVAPLPDEAGALVGTVSFPHMGYDPAGPLGLPPGVPQQALHFA